MTDIYSNHSQFVLLNDNRQRWFDGRTFFVLIIITIPIIIFCGIYTIILKMNDKLLYPKSDFEVPYLLSHRAKTSLLTVYKKNITYSLNIVNMKIKSRNNYKLVCYYNFPSDGRSLQPEDIDPFLCTHINVGFLSIVNNTLDISESQLNTINAMINLKKNNSFLKILVSVGGAGDDSGFGDMVQNHQNRKKFIASTVALVRLYGVDGIDLDWEFPNENLHNDKLQKIHFIQLLEEFRKTINKQNKHKFILTLAVAAPTVVIDNSYKVNYINDYVDFINVMSYDYHFYSKFTPFTGLNSPLFQSVEDKGYFSSLNINVSAHYWLSKGMQRDKINIGIPTYAHTFRLINSYNNGLYAPARGTGKLGGNGFADFAQVCQFLNLNQVVPIFDLDSKSPYATKNTEWISFENEQSISYKAEFVRDYNFGGIMVYSLNSDDFRGSCKLDPKIQNQQFPLVKKVREILNSNYSLF